MAAPEARSLSHRERDGVRGYGPSLGLRPLTRFAPQIDLSPSGRGELIPSEIRFKTEIILL